MKMKILSLALLAVAVLLISGCGQTQTTPKMGTLVMQITDAPPEELSIEKAEVTISNVEVHLAAEGEDENATTEAGWSTVVSEPKTYDLIAIKDVNEVLGQKVLAAGRYTQVRLNVDKATVTINSTQYDLEVPSDKIKLVKGFTIEDNKTTTITLDFDAQESIKAIGNDKYILRPTVKIVQE
ncbi:MAG: DUF4382 domain-containing protein [archaeon]